MAASWPGLDEAQARDRQAEFGRAATQQRVGVGAHIRAGPGYTGVDAAGNLEPLCLPAVRPLQAHFRLIDQGLGIEADGGSARLPLRQQGRVLWGVDLIPSPID